MEELDLQKQSIDAMHELQLLDLKVTPIEEILNLVAKMQLPITETEVRSNVVICRCRHGKDFKTRQEMTFKPVEYCMSAQRASLPNETVFYGIISDDMRHLDNARAIGVSECSKLADGGPDTSGREHIAVSQWDVRTPIKVACIMGEHMYDGVTNNRLLAEIKKNFVSTFKDNEYAQQMSDFVVSEFTKRVNSENDYQYLISAAICHTLLYTYGYEGVVYPSVKLGGQAGMNIAIRPDVVSSKLRIGMIANQCYYKNKGHGFVDIESIWDAYHRRFLKTEKECGESPDVIKEQIHLQEGELEDLLFVED